jgi:hypothetical protein
MYEEYREVVFSVLLAATLSCCVVGVALLATVVLTERPRPSLEASMSSGTQPPASHLHRAAPR